MVSQNIAVSAVSAAPLNPGQILHVPEACAYVGLCRAQVYVLMKAGQFAPKIQLSQRRVGFRVRDLDSWIDAKVTQ